MANLVPDKGMGDFVENDLVHLVVSEISNEVTRDSDGVLSVMTTAHTSAGMVKGEHPSGQMARHEFLTARESVGSGGQGLNQTSRKGADMGQRVVISSHAQSSD